MSKINLRVGVSDNTIEIINEDKAEFSFSVFHERFSYLRFTASWSFEI